MKNIIFTSKSYDRKGKIHEAIEHHNREGTESTQAGKI